MIWPYTLGVRKERAYACIDHWLPEKAYMLEHHAVDIAATQEAAYASITEMPLTSLPLVRALFTLRGIPFRSEMTLLQFFSTSPFVALEEADYEVVFGVVGPFWEFRAGHLPLKLPRSPEEFRAALGEGRMAAIGNFRVDPHAGGVRLWTETWAFTPKSIHRVLFTAYWLAIGPFSAWIRRMLLEKAGERV